MNEWINQSINGWMEEWMNDEWMNEWMDGWKKEWMNDERINQINQSMVEWMNFYEWINQLINQPISVIDNTDQMLS